MMTCSLAIALCLLASPDASEQTSSTPTATKQAASRPPASPERPHTVGLGGRAGGFTFGVGASVRYWRSQKIGFEVGLSHYSVGGTVSDFGIVASSNASVLQIAPSVLFVIGEPDTSKSTIIRPYAGGGLNIYRSSLDARASGFGETASASTSATDMGFQGFAGAEFVFKALPKFGMSGEFGYHSTGTPFAGYSLGGFAISVSGHYYIK